MTQQTFIDKSDGNAAYTIGMATGWLVKLSAIFLAMYLGSTELDTGKKMAIMFIMLTTGLWIVLGTQFYFGSQNRRVRIFLNVAFAFVLAITAGVAYLCIDMWDYDYMPKA